MIGLGYDLTTDHPCSSYGNPVLVDHNGNAYGPADVVPGINVEGRNDWTAVELVRISMDAGLCTPGQRTLAEKFIQLAESCK